MKVFMVLVLSLMSIISTTAQLIESDLYLLDLSINDEIKQVQFLTDYNPNSYNNQASFINDNEVYVTSKLKNNQTDIVLLNLKNQKWKRLTKTNESEYSPQKYTENSFTVVRVESDGVTQNLWEYPNDLKGKGNKLFDLDLKIGYYQHLPNFKTALFIIDNDDFDLYIADSRYNKVNKIADDIGRSFSISKSGELVFLKRTTPNSYRLKKYNTINQNITDVCESLSGAQDFCLFGTSEEILMASGPQIFKFSLSGSSWILWKDLSEYGINNISRMTFRDGKLILVNTK